MFESDGGSERGSVMRWEGRGRMGWFGASGGRIELLEEPLVRVVLVKLGSVGLLVRFL